MPGKGTSTARREERQKDVLGKYSEGWEEKKVRKKKVKIKEVKLQETEERKGDEEEREKKDDGSWGG